MKILRKMPLLLSLLSTALYLTACGSTQQNENNLESQQKTDQSETDQLETENTSTTQSRTNYPFEKGMVRLNSGYACCRPWHLRLIS